MNREMKCRAWHKDEGKFLEISKLYVCDGAVMCVQDINESEQEIDPPMGMDDKNLSLVWYTGLKDKNGVEIYEGDILEIAGQSLLRFEIVYDSGRMAFMRRWIEKRVPATRGNGEMEHMSANTDFLEVVGNRFGNPELMEG